MIAALHFLSRLCVATGRSLTPWQRRKQASRDRRMESAEWMFIFLNAVKWLDVTKMTEQLLDHFSSIVSVHVIARSVTKE